jgi:hypothetical protein
MPIRATYPSNTPGDVYASPFRGKVEHTAQIPVNITALNNTVVDSDGYIKPGTPLTAAGGLVGAPAAAQSYRGTGNGLMSGLTADAAAADDVYTITLILAAANGGTFRVVSQKRGVLANAVVGVAYDDEINFTIADGATDFIVGDEFTVLVTSAAVFGMVIEAIKVADGNAAGDLAAASSAFELGVATIAQCSQDVIEDNLGRALTAAELAGFLEPGCMLKLLS